jgi:transposase-like protein/Zn ribbon nucleic-acid-binding protein
VERFPKSLLEFQSLFSTDEVCIEYLVERRWPNGFVCPKCRGNSAWRLNSRPLWECRDCGRQTSITAGTLMAKTKLALRVWFWAAYLMSTHSNGLSALQLRSQLGVDYKTAWLLAAKLRRAMVNPDRSKLGGVIEIDQTEIPFRQENPPPGVGGRQGMITVVGAVEIVDRATGGTPKWAYNKKLLDTTPRRLRLQVIPNNLAATLDAFVLANVEPGSVILTDDHASYVNLSKLGYTHDPKTVGLMAAHVVLPWVHRVFALLKRWGLGVYHGLRRKHIQTYLDEYCFRFNRRHWRRVSFEKILGIASAKSALYAHQITGGRPRDSHRDKAKRPPHRNAKAPAQIRQAPPDVPSVVVT